MPELHFVDTRNRNATLLISYLTEQLVTNHKADIHYKKLQQYKTRTVPQQSSFYFFNAQQSPSINKTLAITTES